MSPGWAWVWAHALEFLLHQRQCDAEDQTDDLSVMIEDALMGSSPFASRTKSGLHTRGRNNTLPRLTALQEENVVYRLRPPLCATHPSFALSATPELKPANKDECFVGAIAIRELSSCLTLYLKDVPDGQWMALRGL